MEENDAWVGQFQHLIPANDQERIVEFGWGETATTEWWTWSIFSEWNVSGGLVRREVGAIVISKESPEAWVHARAEWPGMQTLAGWPMLSLFGEEWAHWDQSSAPLRPMAVISALRAPASVPYVKPWPARLLLLRPIFPGFAINTVFYAAICWLLFAAPFAVRRRRRVKRGLCPACAYPVGNSEICTECGALLPLPVGEGRGEGEVAT
jgi:hypothetical protein